MQLTTTWTNHTITDLSPPTYNFQSLIFHFNFTIMTYKANNSQNCGFQQSQQPGKSYAAPDTKFITGYAVCAGIEIGSGQTTPEVGDSNNYIFEEENIVMHHSVWNDWHIQPILNPKLWLDGHQLSRTIPAYNSLGRLVFAFAFTRIPKESRYLN